MRFLPLLVLIAQITAVTGAAAQRAKTPRLDVHGDPLPDGPVVRLGTVRFQLADRVAAATLSPDGAIVAMAFHRYQEDRQTRIEVMRVRFIESSTGKIIREHELANFDAMQMQFTPDGKNLVIRNWSDVAFVDAASGKVAKSIKIDDLREPVGFTGDGNWLAAQPNKSIHDAPVGIWDVKTGKQVATLPGKGASCRGLAFGPEAKRLLLWSMVPLTADGKSITIGGDYKETIACIDVKTRKIVGETTLTNYRQVALSPDGETIACEAEDRQSVHIRHLPTGAERTAIGVKQAKFAFTPDAKVLFAVDQEGHAALWDAAKGTKIRDLEGPLASKDYKIVGISKDGKTIAVLDGGWKSAAGVVVWNAETGKRAAKPPGHDGAITCLAYVPGGKFLVSGSIDRTVRLWNPTSGAHLRKLADHPDAISALAIAPDGRFVASASADGLIRICAITDGKLAAAFAGPRRGAVALAFSPDGKTLFAGGPEPELLAWEIKGGKEVMRLKTGNDGSVLAFADGGAFAVTANGEIRAEDTPERLQVWSPLRKPAVVSIPLRDKELGDDPFRGSVRCESAAFSADGRMIASSQISTYEGIRPSYGAAQLRLWERTSGQPIRTLAPTITHALAFSPNGRLLASGSTGKSGHLRVGYGMDIDVWDTVTGRKAGTLPVSPKCMAFSPDGTRLATGGRDHDVLIWEVPKVQLPKNAVAPSAAEREVWWTALGADAKDAYKAMGQMIDAPEHAMAFLKERVRPVQRSDAAEVAKLITKLDSGTFAERQKAQFALEKMGEGAAHLIDKALEAKHSVELRRRLETVLSKYNETTTLSRQQQRAVALLEWLETPAAREVLRPLADGAPRARLTIEARAALKRLQS